MTINLVEVPKENWSHRNGEAQYVSQANLKGPMIPNRLFDHQRPVGYKAGIAAHRMEEP